MAGVFSHREIFLNWLYLCHERLFPPHFYEKFTPFHKMKLLDRQFLNLHEAHDADLHELIPAIFRCKSSESVYERLRQTPPEIVMLYYARIEVVTETLRNKIESDEGYVTLKTDDLKYFYLQLLLA